MTTKSNPNEDDENDTGATEEGQVLYRMERYNEDGFLVEEAYDPKKLKSVKASGSKAAATVMLYFDTQGKHTDTEIKIESTAAKEILQKRLKHYPGYHWEGPRLSIFAPFKPLIYNWDGLVEETKVVPPTDGARDLDKLLTAVKGAQEVNEYFETRDAMDGSVSFEFLWTIFPPGEFVLLPSSFMKQAQVFIIRDVVQRQSQRGDHKKYVALLCWGYDWDGSARKFSRVGVELRIEFYKGQRLVTSLPCYPLRHCKNIESLRTTLNERGEKFREFCIRPRGKQMFMYNGLAYYRGTGVRPTEGSDRSTSLVSPPSRLQIGANGIMRLLY